MKRFRRSIAALALGLLATATVAQSEPVRLQPVELLDSGTVAFRGLLPVGWTATGGIVWGDGCSPYGFNISYVAQSPDRRFGVAFLPSQTWYVDPRPNCQSAAHATLRDLLLAQVRSGAPDARLLDYRARPELLGLTSVPAPVPDLSMNGANLTVRAVVDAGEGLFAFTSPDGEDMRATALGAALFSLAEIQMIDPFGGPGTVQRFSSGGSEWGFLAWAPNGQLDLRLSEAIRKSFVPTPDWAAAIAQHRAVIDRGNAETAATISRINADTAREVSGIIAATGEAAAAAQDRMARENLEAIRGVETWVDTAGRTVQLDYTYPQAWQLDDGTYVLTDDTMFNPVATFGIGGQPLTVAE